MNAKQPCFTQLHIDTARFASDDFNLFHDPVKWRRLKNNPFEGPIVLGFQTECWLAEALREIQESYTNPQLIRELRCSNFQINFAGALKPGQSFKLIVKKPKWDHDKGILSYRVMIKNENGIVLMGYHRLSRQALTLGKEDLTLIPNLDSCVDRKPVTGTPYFLKRKYMMTANAKNFLLGSLVDPSHYFDELENKVIFPELFPVSYISCALLERAHTRGHDFETDPMVYTQHHISLDRVLTENLKSNDILNILVAPEDSNPEDEMQTNSQQEKYHCFGIVDGQVLFRARIALAPLSEVVKAHAKCKG
ncbi:MAG: hypothetical protein AXA67_01275 [Methylothermaceae bacteria B42]|nr:MAG: hypothetical protein AXA67_01275 [Methylothermaceae bacteria B42]HHJ40510.1 hypothetical protein [Methylothermaceae bacterium]